MKTTPYRKISASPTLPTSQAVRTTFDVAELYRGPLETGSPTGVEADPLAEKLRQAYFWIINNAIISPHYDVEYNHPNQAPQQLAFGDLKHKVTLPSGQSYSSFALLPLLTFATRRRCLLVGGPGRGKTASAILMGILAGYSLQEVRRAIQHGQPQMTISDLLGNPLPADLVNAQDMDSIRIAWRKWLGMRIKIIDEYNRIPTRTQSALLTVLADGYAEMLDHIYECPPAAWYLTANDDGGGGTYQVIEALRDRVDVVVHALHFNPRFLNELLTRIEEGITPEEAVPEGLIFNEDEIRRMGGEIRKIALPARLRRRLEFFASQLEFFESGGKQFEYKTKDTVKLAGLDFGLVSAQESGRDRVRDLGSQTMNGLSVRAMLSALHYIKAMAWFRGNSEVELEDIRQILPFVLHDKLVINEQSPFFEAAGNGVYRVDRISWIRNLFDLACAELERVDGDRDDPVAELNAQIEQGLEGLTEAATRERLVRIERLLAKWSQGGKLYGPMHDDILNLKYLHQRYTNYLEWLHWTAR